MATQSLSLFTRYKLTDDESRIAHLLSQENLYAIQNLIAEAAEERVALIYDPLNPLQFAQRDAELKGQINILQHLLTLHEDSLTQINQPEN